MMKTFVLSALAVLVSTSAFAQSPLADAARREAARRGALKTGTIPSYTNEDLSKLPPRFAPALPTQAATVVTDLGVVGGAAPKPDAPPAAGEAAPRDEKYWRERITTARTNLSRAQIFADSLQSRINALSADFVNRDDPAQRTKIAEDRQRALDELARVQTEIADFTKAIADIEDEARRLSVPPGWLR